MSIDWEGLGRKCTLELTYTHSKIKMLNTIKLVVLYFKTFPLIKLLFESGQVHRRWQKNQFQSTPQSVQV